MCVEVVTVANGRAYRLKGTATSQLHLVITIMGTELLDFFPKRPGFWNFPVFKC